MTTTKHKSKLAARVAAVNKAHAYAKELHPKLAAVFAPFVGCKVTKIGRLVAKAEAAVKALDLPYSGGLNVSRNPSTYTISYNVQACESFDWIAYYHDVGVYVGELKGDTLDKLMPLNGTYRSDYTELEITSKRAEFKAIEKQYEAAKSALFPFGEYDR